MAHIVCCDNPECEAAVRVGPNDDADFVPAGWWELAQAAEMGGHETGFVACSLSCVAVIARMSVGDAAQTTIGDGAE